MASRSAPSRHLINEHINNKAAKRPIDPQGHGDSATAAEHLRLKTHGIHIGSRFRIQSLEARIGKVRLKYYSEREENGKYEWQKEVKVK